MSNLSLDFSDNAFQPLAARMRPENLAQYIGQQHLLAPGKPLPRAIEAGHLHSMILWGPPGTGKTTLAEVIARYASADVERISAVTSGVKEIREAIERARQNRNAGRRTILFVDEVHRFNKSQQDAFLPHIEDGTITFIGATTENRSFELNSALLSRARVYLQSSAPADDIRGGCSTGAMNDKTRGYGGQDIVLPDETRRAIAELVNGDARRALNTLEMMADMAESDDSGKRVLKAELLTEIAGERSARFDNKGDRFYDLISALHKSVRGKSRSAQHYWYARIITAGNPLVCCRRCLTVPRKMSATQTRGRCRVAFRRGTALPAAQAGEANGRLREPSSIWPARRKATRCTPPSKRRWPTRGIVLTTTFRCICAMRRRS